MLLFKALVIAKTLVDELNVSYAPELVQPFKHDKVKLDTLSPGTITLYGTFKVKKPPFGIVFAVTNEN